MPESIPDFDLYTELGVTVDADADVIRAAYRDAVRRSHPDTAPDGVSDAAAKRLNVARDWLLDPGRRARYDESRGVGAWETATGASAPEAAIPAQDDGVEARLDRKDAIGCLEVGWWILLILAAALIFVTLLLIVSGR